MSKMEDLATRFRDDPLLAGLPLRQIVARTGESMGTVQRAKALLTEPVRDRLQRLPLGPSITTDQQDLLQRLDEALATHQTIGRAAKALGLSKKALEGIQIEVDGGLDELPDASVYLVTWAQDDTDIDEALWSNMLAYAAERSGEIIVCPGTYQKGILAGEQTSEALYYPAKIRNRILRDNVELFPGLQLATTANILATSKNPTLDYDTHSGHDSIIIPASRQHTRSVPRMQGKAPKVLRSTGAITVANYAHRAAGQKAAWHHTLGFVVVEWDGRHHHCRHVTATADGAFQDLDWIVANGAVVSRAAPIDTIVAGDIHAEQADPVAIAATFGIDLKRKAHVRDASMLGALRPARVVLHDLLDFKRRNHHDRHDPRQRLRLLRDGRSNVRDEIRDTAWLLRAIAREGQETVVVKSNHDAAFDRWLRSPDALEDEENVGYWHRCNADWFEAIERGEDYDPFREAISAFGGLIGVLFPSRLSSVSRDYPSGPIEYGLHGDVGNAGARGSTTGFRKIAPKAATGHDHTLKMGNGHFGPGTLSRLEMGYNNGLTTWVHGNAIVYSSGHYTTVEIKEDGSWRA